MTQFQPPPFPPLPSQQDDYPAAYATNVPPRWSAAAIAAFILSLLGFLGVTAVLGLIFGIVGIITTSGGRRRGMGLAIAAIPISLVTGVLSIVLLSVLFFGTRAMEIPVTLKAALGADSAAVVDSANALREIGSAAFNNEVSTEALQAWITQINTKHGKLTAITKEPQELLSPTPEGAWCLNFNGKFVNGLAPIRLIFKAEEFFSLRIDDIEIDGSSPRGSSVAPSSTRKEPTPAVP